MCDNDGEGESSGVRITQLPQDVVDKIAAGEVVVRPVNAVKELLENSLDAGASEIRVETSQGGLELIRIQDNGRGIAQADMPLVCARFATSKLRAVEELRSVSTYGFRGEALASISIVAARVSITSRTSTDKCAHRTSYLNGKMEKCMSVAGLPGTSITVERLFNNAPARRAALRYPHEETNRIADLVVKYSVHYPAVSFAFRRLDSNGGGCDFRSTGNGDQHSTIRTLLHAKVTKNLVNVDFTDPTLHFRARACMASPITLFSSTAIQAKQDRQKVFHLFINGRCVECPRLKQALDAVFASKDAHCPFITLSLEIEPNRVDVNVHPTKSIVHFLEQDRIIERLEQEFYKLASQYHKRGTLELSLSNGQPSTIDGELHNKEGSHNTQSCLLGKQSPSAMLLATKNFDGQALSVSSTPLSKMRIRIDASNRSIEEFAEKILNDESPSSSTADANVSSDSPICIRRPSNASGISSVSDVHMVPILNFDTAKEVTSQKDKLFEVDDDITISMSASNQGISQFSGTGSQCSLASICSVPRHFEFQALVQLRRDICRNADTELGELFRAHYLIGFYDSQHVLFQSGPSVYIVRCVPILQEFFYQLAIFSFGNMGSYELERMAKGELDNGDCDPGGLPIRDILKLYFTNTNRQEDKGECEDELVDAACKMLIEHRDLLWNFFSVKINKFGSSHQPLLGALPCLLEGYLPQTASIPGLLHQLAQKVDYSDEKRCYSAIARALGHFFTPFMAQLDEDEPYDSDSSEEHQRIQAVLRAVVFPALKNRFLPPASLWSAIERITHVEQAFKHFGRC